MFGRLLLPDCLGPIPALSLSGRGGMEGRFPPAHSEGLGVEVAKASISLRYALAIIRRVSPDHKTCFRLFVVVVVVAFTKTYQIPRLLSIPFSYEDLPQVCHLDFPCEGRRSRWCHSRSLSSLSVNRRKTFCLEGKADVHQIPYWLKCSL